MSEDERHLPGHSLEGYDADTQRYTWRTPNGSYVQSAPGTRYRLSTEELDYESEQRLIQENKKAYRYFLPFLLIVGLFLFILISPPWRRTSLDNLVKCNPGTIRHDIRQGDTCFDLAQKYDTSVTRLKELNTGLKCESLQIGQTICVPTNA